MRTELQIHRFVLSILSIWIAIFIALMVTLGVQETGDKVAVEVILLYSIVVSSGLVGTGMFEMMAAIELGQRHRREVAAYLILASLALASGVFLATRPQASLQTISLVVSPHAFLLGCVQLRIARHLRHHQSQRLAMVVCGVLDLCAALVLAGAEFLNSEWLIVRILGLTAIAALLQFVPFLFARNPVSAHTHP